MEFIYSLFIAPIEYLVEFVFLFLRTRFESIGVIGAVLGVSIIINFLALPLYNMADAVKEKERQRQKKLEPRVKRIKAAFKGDEQFMMLSAYYRQNDYNPLYSLKASLSILLEIPFFIAAYNYLSNCSELLGQSFWIFKDLSKPDCLFSVSLFGHDLPVNILPLLMTAINLISSVVYLKESSVQDKVQLFGLSFVFLVLLYNSPAGLVIYWIFNNLFSFCKNVFLKLKLPKKLLYIFFITVLIFAALFFILKRPDSKLIKKVLLLGITLFFILLPVCYKILQKTEFFKKVVRLVFDGKILPEEKKIFYFSCIVLALLLGFVLPASVISTSPIEFSFLGKTDSPLKYILNSLFFYTGLCVLWPVIIFKISDDRVKKILSMLMFTLALSALANAYVFKSDYGNLDCSLKISTDLLNIAKWVHLCAVIFPVVVVVLFLASKRTKIFRHIPSVLIAFCIAECGFSFYKTAFIKKEFNSYKISREKRNYIAGNISPVFHLSKTQKNVVILFLDRAISSFLPYIMQQFPELEEKYDGFVYYPNCLTFGQSTNIGAPAMLGGYEYTPEEINKRSSELLIDKHNEATLVMPRLFLDAGFDVLVSDVPWANYACSGDSSAFEKEGINSTWQNGMYSMQYLKSIGKTEENNFDFVCKKQIVNFAMIQALVPVVREFFHYTVDCYRKDSDLSNGFVNNFSTLFFLDLLTDFTSDKNTYTFIGNDVTHNPTKLNAPDYLYQDSSCNDCGKYIPSDETSAENDLTHYHVNAASIKIIASWLEYLKSNDCYDNTRIIIVADHGRGIPVNSDRFKDFKDSSVPASMNPLFMVKDFNSRGKIKTDNSFMTNADTLFEAKKDLPVSEYNPFTKQYLVPQKKNGVHIYYGKNWNCTEQKTWKKFELDETNCWIIKDDISKPENWKPLSFEMPSLK